MPDVYRSRKRICVAAQPDDAINSAWDGSEDSGIGTSDMPTDTKTALLFLKNMFPVEKFEGRLPPMMVRHQLYSIVKNRTVVDKEVGDLRSTGEIRLFKLGSEASEFGVVFTEDYKEHVRTFTADLSISKVVVEKFLSTVVSHCQDISLNKHKMMYEFQFKDEEITQLVKACVLTVRDVGSWWVAIPSAGMYMKSFMRGRKAVLTMIRKCKYKEILYQDLECRKLPKVARLGMTYHIHDIIGADLVDCIPSSSGQLLRLKE